MEEVTKKATVIEIEGIDGSGKTTGYNYLCDQLEAKGFKVLRTREVGSPLIPLCVELRKLILNPELSIKGEAMEFIFAAMRVINQDFYSQNESKYDYIVSDRGWLSHLAYTDHNVSKEFTHLFYNNVVKTVTKLPSLALYFDIEPDVAAKRRVTRGEALDAIEKKGPEFQKNVALSFKSHILNSRMIARTYFIDANKDIPGVRAELDGVIEKITTKAGE